MVKFLRGNQKLIICKAYQWLESSRLIESSKLWRKLLKVQNKIIIFFMPKINNIHYLFMQVILFDSWGRKRMQKRKNRVVLLFCCLKYGKIPSLKSFRSTPVAWISVPIAKLSTLEVNLDLILQKKLLLVLASLSLKVVVKFGWHQKILELTEEMYKNVKPSMYYSDYIT